MQSIKYRFKNIALMMNNESVEIRKYCFAAGRISPFFFFFFFNITFLRSEIMEVVSDYWPPLWHRVFRSARFKQRARI